MAEKQAGAAVTPKYPWDDIRRDYVEGLNDGVGDSVRFPSHAELAEKHGIKRVATIGERAAKEGWADQRSAFRASLAKVRRRKRVSELAEEASKFDGQTLTIARIGMQLVQRRMGELAQSARKAADEEKRIYQETGIQKSVEAGVDARELSQLGSATSEFLGLANRVFGDVTDDTQGLLPQETLDEREAAREMTVFHEHTVTVQHTTVLEVARVIAEVEAEVVRATRQAALPSLPEEDPQADDAEVVE